jgi:uncharacterized protein (TIGR02265 family)
MQDTPTLLKARRATQAEPHTIQGLFLSAAVRVLEQELGKDETTRLLRQLQVPAKPVNFFRYAAALQLDLMDAGAAALTSPSRTYSEGLAMLSEGVAGIFFDSPVGKTLISLANAKPHGILSIAPTAYKTVASFGTRSYARIGEREGGIVYKGELLGASYTQGLLKSGLRLACNLDVEVSTTESKSDTDFTMVARW